MGGDQLVAALAGDEFEREHGDAVREAEGEHYMAMIEEVAPLPAARELLERLRERGHAIVLSSSAKPHEVDHYLDLLDARELVDGVDHVGRRGERPSPRPTSSRRRSSRSGGGPAVMVGDSTWDCEAAERAGIRSIGVLTGGFSERELRDAGAAGVFTDLPALLAALDETPLRIV